MPIREFGCHHCHQVIEEFQHRYDAPAPECCGTQMITLFSTFSTPFDKSLNHYNDSSKERLHQEKDGGHWVQRVRSSLSGNPEPFYVKDRQAQREFVKSEGLTDPADLPPTLEVKEDGMGYKNTQGDPGCWV